MNACFIDIERCWMTGTILERPWTIMYESGTTPWTNIKYRWNYLERSEIYMNACFIDMERWLNDRNDAGMTLNDHIRKWNDTLNEYKIWLKLIYMNACLLDMERCLNDRNDAGTTLNDHVRKWNDTLNEDKIWLKLPWTIRNTQTHVLDLERCLNDQNDVLNDLERSCTKIERHLERR